MDEATLTAYPADADDNGLEAEATSGSSPSSGDAAGGSTLLAGGGSFSGGRAASVPEQYELQAPEGSIWDEGQMAAFHGQARELGLTQTQAQRLLDVAHGNQQQVEALHQQQVADWAEALRLDRELGGAKFDATVMTARAGLRAFDTDGSIGAMLEETGYGNHPSVVRLFQRIGRALAEDTLATGSGVGGHASLEDRLFRNMQM